MSCTTCSHTMHGVGDGKFQCPRCGTLTGCYAGGSAFVPWLVQRCREFEKTLHIDGSADARIARWHQLGIAESINLSESRAT